MDKNILKDLQIPKNVVYEKNIENNFYGKFVMKPLEKGFAITVGNSLRRVIYSSMRGFAITFVRFDWESSDGNTGTVASEFDNIPFAVEDTIEIIMNLKKLRVKLLEDEMKKTFTVSIDGNKKITGSDFQVSNDLEVVNKDLHLMTLQEGKLNIEFTVENGKGFVTAEEKIDEDNTIGNIPIDSIFTPIKNVNFNIEPTRVGNIADYEKLTVEIETDGTINPEEAIENSAFILIKYFSKFIENVIAESEEIIEEEQEDEIAEDDRRLLNILDKSLDTLEFTERVKNCFTAANVKVFKDLLVKTESEVADLRNFGKKSLDEVKDKLAERNLNLGMKDKIQEIEKKYNKN